MLQAKVTTIYFIHDWAHPIGSLQDQYTLAQSKLDGGVRQVAVHDPRADWANNVQGNASRRRAASKPKPKASAVRTKRGK